MEIALWVALLFALVAHSLLAPYIAQEIDNVARQTEAQQPLYSATLTQSLPDWPTQQPTKSNATSIAFTHGGYQLSSPGTDANWIVTAWTPLHDRGDFAMRVTMAVTGVQAGANSQFYAVGIKFDGQANTSKYNSISIDTLSGCFLALHTPPGEGHNVLGQECQSPNSHIQTGANPTNTLLIVRHDSRYLIFINGALAIYFYTPQQTRTSGAIGFFASGAVTVQFKDLAMYPVPHELDQLPFD